MAMIKARQIFLAAAIAFAGSQPAASQALSDIISAEILPGWRTESGTHMAGVRLTLSQGWKTYWRSPGETGIPPEFNWAGSQNIRAVQIHWPTPEVFDFNGMQSIGYDREVILPVEIWPNQNGQPIQLTTDMTLGVCRDICVQANVGLGALLPPGGKSDPAIRAAMRAQPLSARQAGVSPARCSVEPTGNGLRLLTEIDAPRMNGKEVVVVETSNPQVWVSETQTRREGATLISQTDLVSANRKPFAFDRSGVTITLLSAGRAVEVQGCTRL